MKFMGQGATDMRIPLLAGKQSFYSSTGDQGDNALSKTAVIVVTSDDLARQFTRLLRGGV